MERVLTLFVFAVICCSKAFAQDTSSTIEKEIVRIIGTLFNEAKGSILKDYRTNGDKNVLGTALKEAMSGVARRTKDRITQNGLPDLSVGLPTVLQQNKSVFVKQGKENLLKDFQSSIKQAAQQALFNSLFTMVDNVTDIDVNVLVDKIDDDNFNVTDIFKNAQRNKLISVAKPFAKTAFKLSGGKKLYKKIEKTIKQNEGKKMNIDNEEYLAEVVTDLFFDALQEEEKRLKKNPLGIIENLLDIFNKN